MYDVGQENAGKYLQRGAEYGLLSVEKINERNIFTIIPGWRDRAGVFHKIKIQAPKPQIRYDPQPLEAV